jgi:hypothetical protein
VQTTFIQDQVCDFVAALCHWLPNLLDPLGTYVEASCGEKYLYVSSTFYILQQMLGDDDSLACELKKTFNIAIYRSPLQVPNHPGCRGARESHIQIHGCVLFVRF